MLTKNMNERRGYAVVQYMQLDGTKTGWLVCIKLMIGVTERVSACICTMKVKGASRTKRDIYMRMMSMLGQRPPGLGGVARGRWPWAVVAPPIRVFVLVDDI